MGSHQQQHEESGEGENYTNTLTEHHVQSAIEMGLQSRQQTYQEFMDSFLVLKNEDVKKYNEAKMKRELEKMGDSEDMEAVQSDDVPQDGGKFKHKEKSKLENIKIAVNSEDELETEELGEGTYSPRCTDADKFGGGKKFVQVDNFVEDNPSESDSSDEDEVIEYEVGAGDAGYVSSFGQVQDATTDQNLQEGEVEDDRIHQGSIEMEDTEEERIVSPLPGEAEDSCSNTEALVNIIHETQLEISTNNLPEGVSTQDSEQENNQESTNEVQPFTLDENFDYDNVVLSKKWDLNQVPPNQPP